MNTDVGPCVAEPCQGSYNVECTDTSDFQLLLHALPVDDLRRLFGPLCTFENWDELVVSHVHFAPGPSGDDIVFQAKELSGLARSVSVFVPSELTLQHSVIRASQEHGTPIILRGILATMNHPSQRTFGNFFGTTPDTAFYLRCKQTDLSGMSIFTLFAGGISGWTYAVRFLSRLGIPVRTPLALDFCEAAVYNYSSTHAVQTICGGLSFDLLKMPSVIHGRVQDNGPWMAASLLQVNAATISWPCQTFSHAGPGTGWISAGGDAFKASMGKASLLQLRILLFENVGPVWEDLSHRATFVSLLMQHGYTLVAADVFGLAAVTSADRKRFLAVAVHDSVIVDPGRVRSVLSNIRMTFSADVLSMSQMDAWFDHSPDFVHEQAILTQQQVQIYSDPSLLPRRGSGIRVRFVTKDQPMPATSLMRKYSQQHTISSCALALRKLLGDLRQDDDGTIRFFTAVELLMAMGVTDAIISPVELSLACELVGNSIAEIHALAALWIAVKGLLHMEVDMTFADILRHFNQARLRASQVHFANLSGALVVHRTNEKLSTHVQAYHLVHALIRVQGSRYEVDVRVGDSIASAFSMLQLAFPADDCVLTVNGKFANLSSVLWYSCCIECTQHSHSISPTLHFQVCTDGPWPKDGVRPAGLWQAISADASHLDGQCLLVRCWTGNAVTAELLLDPLTPCEVIQQSWMNMYGTTLHIDTKVYSTLAHCTAHAGVVDLQVRIADLPKFQIFVQGIGTGPKCIMVDGRTTFREVLDQFELSPDSFCLFRAAHQCPLSTSLEDAGVRSHDWLQVCKRDRGGGKPPRVEGDAIAALTTMLHNQGADKTEADNFARAVMPKVGAPRMLRTAAETHSDKIIKGLQGIASLLQCRSNCRTLAPVLSHPTISRPGLL